MLFDHFTHLRIPGPHNIAHLITVLCNIHAAGQSYYPQQGT